MPVTNTGEIPEYSITWLIMAVYLVEEWTADKGAEDHQKMNFDETLMKQYKNILPLVFMGGFINKAIPDAELGIGMQ
jgi:hypothetical protein